MNKPSFLTDEQYEELKGLHGEMDDFEETTRIRTRNGRILKSEDAPMSIMIAGMLRAIREAQEAEAAIERMHERIEERKEQGISYRDEASGFHQALERAYPELSMEDILELIRTY